MFQNLNSFFQQFFVLEVSSTTQATVVSPVTLTTVRNMSKGRSMPKISAKPSIGIPTESRTIMSITMEPPGMPGVPIDEMVAVAKMSNI